MGSSAAQSRKTADEMIRYLFITASVLVFSFVVLAQDTRNLTPLEIEIQKQQQRLSSGDQEERREAIKNLGGMGVAAPSRAALPGLKDPPPIIRATATKAILWIGAEESAAALLPLLNDKD